MPYSFLLRVLVFFVRALLLARPGQARPGQAKPGHATRPRQSGQPSTDNSPRLEVGPTEEEFFRFGCWAPLRFLQEFYILKHPSSRFEKFQNLYEFCTVLLR